MKAYGFTIAVVDLEEYGRNEIRRILESVEYISPIIFLEAEADIGEWDDDHPLNLHDSSGPYARNLFVDKWEIPQVEES